MPRHLRLAGLIAIVAATTLITACHGKTPEVAQKASSIVSWSVAEPGAPVLSDIVWSGSHFAAVGAHGSVVTSADGSTWTSQNSNVTSDLLRIAWSGSTFVAIAADGTIITSPDGAVWTRRDNPLSSGVSLRSITWASAFHQFIIIGNGNAPAFLASEDGQTWTVTTLPSMMPNVELANIACSDSTCLAVGAPYGGPPFVLASNDIVQWTSLQLSPSVTAQPYADAFYDIAWSGTQFVGLGIIGVVPPPSYIATSRDGANWDINDLSASEPPLNVYINTVRPSGNALIALGESSLLTSPDGNSWTSHGSTPGLDLLSVAGSEATGIYVAVSASDQATGTGYAALLTTNDLSTNTITWTESLAGFNLAAVAWSGDTYIAVGSFGTVQTSPDGRAWTSPTSVTGFNLNGVASNGRVTVAVGAPPPAPAAFAGPIIISSHNNVDWNAQAATIPDGTSLADGGLHAVMWSGDLFVAVGDAIFTSSDGNTWTWRAPGTENRLYAVASSNDKYVAVGEAGTLLSSTDAKTWTSGASGVTQDLSGVASSSETFVVVGASGVVLTSADASTWTAQSSGTHGDLEAVAWTGAEFVAAGAGGTLLTSTDGTSWKAVRVLTDRTLTGVAAAATGETACVGYNGTILAGTP